MRTPTSVGVLFGRSRSSTSISSDVSATVTDDAGSAIDHGHPKYSPGDDATGRDQPDQSLNGPQSGIFNLTTRFEDFMKHFYFPTQGIPL